MHQIIIGLTLIGIQLAQTTQAPISGVPAKIIAQIEQSAPRDILRTKSGSRPV